MKLKAKIIVSVKLSGLMDKELGKIAIDSPVSILVGLGNRTSGNFAPDAHVKKLASHYTQAALDVTKTFTVCQLGKGNAQKLIETCKRTIAIILVVSLNTATKLFNGEKTHDLRKYSLAIIHWLLAFDVNLNHREAYQPG